MRLFDRRVMIVGAVVAVDISVEPTPKRQGQLVVFEFLLFGFALLVALTALTRRSLQKSISIQHAPSKKRTLMLAVQFLDISVQHGRIAILNRRGEKRLHG